MAVNSTAIPVCGQIMKTAYTRQHQRARSNKKLKGDSAIHLCLLFGASQKNGGRGHSTHSAYVEATLPTLLCSVMHRATTSTLSSALSVQQTRAIIHGYRTRRTRREAADGSNRRKAWFTVVETQGDAATSHRPR